MSGAPVISVRNVSKAYRIWESPAARILSPLQASLGLKAKAARSYRDFWALKEVSFEVSQGEAIGIIGRNGSGKSTLLQIIAGTLRPTRGEVQVAGRVAALLELGSGFNPEFTGRENVHLNGTVLGLTPAELSARFDAIAAFADIGDHLDQPVKTYSSGMTMRLAFAVCAHVDARVLIIDEALGVGDARFQLKCARTIDRFIAEGRTLLFVSHDTNSVNRLCTAAILVEQGRLQLLHSPRMVTNLYAKMMTDDRGLAAINADLQKAAATPFERVRPAPEVAGAPDPSRAEIQRLSEAVQQERRRAAEETLRADALQLELDAKIVEGERLRQLSESEGTPVDGEISGREFTMGDGGVVIEKIEALNEAGEPQRVCRSGAPLRVQVQILAQRDIPTPIFAVRLRNAKGIDIYGTNTVYRKVPTPDLRVGERIEVVFTLTANVLAGQYFISAGCSHFEGNDLIVHHRRYDALEITVQQDDRSFGVAQCHAEIAIRKSAPPMPGDRRSGTR